MKPAVFDVAVGLKLKVIPVSLARMRMVQLVAVALSLVAAAAPLSAACERVQLLLDDPVVMMMILPVAALLELRLRVSDVDVIPPVLVLQARWSLLDVDLPVLLLLGSA